MASGLELKVTADDVNQFYTGEFGMEFLAKVSATAGKLDEKGSYHLNVFVSPMNQAVSSDDNKDWLAYLCSVLGSSYAGFQLAMDKSADVLRQLAKAANHGYLTGQQHPDLDLLVGEHLQHLSTFAAAYGPLLLQPEPQDGKQKILKSTLEGILTFVVVANTLYAPSTSREFIAHINEAATLDQNYLVGLRESALERAKTL